MSVDPVTETLISAGPLGAIIIALGVAYWRQGLALKAAQEARVQDAQTVTTTLLELNEKWLVAINALTGAVTDLKGVVNELKAVAAARRGDVG